MRSAIIAARSDMKAKVMGRRSHTSLVLSGARWYQEDPTEVNATPRKKTSQGQRSARARKGGPAGEGGPRRMKVRPAAPTSRKGRLERTFSALGRARRERRSAKSW